MVKKTGKIPTGKFDSKFVLPVYSYVKVGKEQFKKLDFFIGYKVEKVSLDCSNHRKGKVLIKILTGKNKGFVYKGKFSHNFCGYKVEFDKFHTWVRIGNILDFTYLMPEKDDADYLKFEDTIDCKQLSSIVYSQNQEIENKMLEERSKLMEKYAEENKKLQEKNQEMEKLTKENNKIFE